MEMESPGSPGRFGSFEVERRRMSLFVAESAEHVRKHICMSKRFWSGIALGVSCMVVYFYHSAPLGVHSKAHEIPNFYVNSKSAQNYVTKCLSGSDPFRNASSLFHAVQDVNPPANHVPEVSIVVPTYFPRRYLHPFLYSNYRSQSYCKPDAEGRSKCELVIYDNAVPVSSKCIDYGTQVGQGPCAYKSGRGESADQPGTFFTEAMWRDKTVTYAHTTRIGCRGTAPGTGSQSQRNGMRKRMGEECIDIGEKRNELAKRARGQFLVHFDDDDFYGEEYVADRIADIKRHMQTRNIDASAPLIVKGLRWLEWDMTPLPPEGSSAGGVGNTMCILDLQYPTKCEDPDPGLDAEYGRSCGAQAGMDWGFAWVYTRATVWTSKNESVCPFFQTSLAEEQLAIRCVTQKDTDANRLTPSTRRVVSIVAPEFQLLKIDASESTTSFMNPCDSYVNWWSRQNIIAAFGYVEDIDTKIFRRPGTACYIMTHHIFAKYGPAHLQRLAWRSRLLE
jgi:hypothetical protein